MKKTIFLKEARAIFIIGTLLLSCIGVVSQSTKEHATMEYIIDDCIHKLGLSDDSQISVIESAFRDRQRRVVRVLILNDKLPETYEGDEIMWVPVWKMAEMGIIKEIR